jgi:hypothetical protein
MIFIENNLNPTYHNHTTQRSNTLMESVKYVYEDCGSFTSGNHEFLTIILHFSAGFLMNTGYTNNR